MSNKTASGLVAYCKAQLGLPYWWGTFGNTATASLLAYKRNQYPSYYTAADFPAQFGKRVHDCVGLIKGYRWSDTPTAVPAYVASQDVAVGGLYNQCSQRGSIGSMPDQPGVCVFMAGMTHVGVYIGEGYVIEARGHAYGVVKTALKARGWAFWGKPDWLAYDTARGNSGSCSGNTSTSTKGGTRTVTVTMQRIEKGSEGAHVRAAQALLRGHKITDDSGTLISVDGGFGAKTYQGTIKMQKKLFPKDSSQWDGIWGTKTWTAALTTSW